MANSRGPGPVPDRWLDCPRKSSRLIANKFLAFKTPLSSRFDDQVPIKSRFPPSMIFRSMKNYRVRIGLWIDLTNTSRFYPEEDVSSGYAEIDPEGEVRYVKLGCRGHGETPSLEQVSVFVNVCDKFIKKNPLNAIGVHCTHGFNRTGFMICAYLVEKMDWSIEVALKEFSEARPPGIYKLDYIKELFKRYDDEVNTISAPPRPDWSNENGEQDNGHTANSGFKRKINDHGNSYNSPGGKRKRPTNAPTFMDGIPGVKVVTDGTTIDKVQKFAKDACKFEKMGFPGSQPVSMDRENLKFLRDKPYRVSWKADGTRYMMVILGKDEVYFLDRDNSVFQVEGLRFVHRKDLNKHITNSLMDGEMVIDRHEGQVIPRYLIYDIICVNGIDVSNFPFYPQRTDCINADIIKPRIQALTEGKIDRNAEPFSVRLKEFYPVEKTSSYFSDKFCKQLTHEPDGLIFQPADEPYTPGQSPYVLKWKPPSLNTVDFRLNIVKESGEGMLTRKVGHLYVGGHNLPFASMKYTSAIKDMHNKIIECAFDSAAKTWVFLRERTDKSFPNAYKTAMSVCHSIRYPVTRNDLLYFIEHNRYRSDRELMPPPMYQDR